MKVMAITVVGDSGKAYEVKASVDGTVHCACAAWKFQKIDPKLRSCKHIDYVKALVK